jgi:hypothetical protein
METDEAKKETEILPESLEQKEQPEKIEKEKTPEEKKAENIEKLTQGARDFINEKRERKREEELREKLEEEAGKAKQSKLEEEIKTVPEPEEKRGFFGSMKEKYKLWQLKRKGFEDPEKAMEIIRYLQENTDRSTEGVNKGSLKYEKKFYESRGCEIESIKPFSKTKDKFYSREDYDYEITVKNTYFGKKSLKNIKKLMESKSNPLGTMEEFRKLYTGEHGLPFWLMNDDESEAIFSHETIYDDLIALNQLGMENGYLDREALIKIIENKEAMKILSDPECQERFRELNGLLERPLDIKNLELASKIIADERKIEMIKLFKERRRGRSFNSYDIQEGSILEKILSDEEAMSAIFKSSEVYFLDKGEFIYELFDMPSQGIPHERFMELRKKIVEEGASKQVNPELFKDEKFLEFVENFKILAGDEFKDGLNRDWNGRKGDGPNLANLFEDPNSLAFFQTFKELNLLGDLENGLDIEKFHKLVAEWKDNHRYSPERTDDILDPEFIKFVNSLALDNRFSEMNYYLDFYQDPEVRESFSSPDGRELLKFIGEKKIPIQNCIDCCIDCLKYHTGIIETLKKSDSFFIISSAHDLSALARLHENPELCENILNFMEENNLNSGGKKHTTDIDLLEKFLEQKDLLDMEYFKKYSEFYFNDKIAVYIQNNPKKISELFSLAEDGYLDGKTFWSDRLFLYSNLDGILSVPREKRGAYVNLFRLIDNSPSQEIQRIKNELIAQILQLDDPEEAYRRIEEIFIKNNLPPVGKIFKVFSIIYPPRAMDDALRRDENLSPCLREASQRKRYFMIYKDLINIHVKSGNRAFLNYIEIANNGQAIFDKIENEGVESLDEDEKKQAEIFLKKMKTLWENSNRGMKIDADEIRLEGGVDSAYQEIKQSIGAKEGQTVADRISQMFLAPAGYESVEQVLAEAKKSKLEANERGIETAELMRSGRFNVRNGDLIKSVQSHNIESILQGGAVAREFLGKGSASDSTPFDSDVLRVSKAGENASLSENIKNYFSEAYGDLNVIIKNRGQFYETSGGNSKGYDSSKLELFKTGKISDEHYGIRTGLPSSEIDLMVINEKFAGDEKRATNLFFEIAENGFYIPVADTAGNLLFTSEMYQEYRKFFSGLEAFEGGPIEFLSAKDGDRNFSEISKMKKELPKDRERVDEISSKIRGMISEVLEKNGIKLKDKWDTSIIGAEIMDTGSTARHTNAPNNYDFDLVLRLDSADMPKVSEVIKEFQQILQAESYGDSHGDNNGGYQLRAKKATGIDGNPMDIDIGFVGKSELVQFGSHNAVEEKLKWIKNNIGQEAYEETIANVILTKQVLKEGKAYKKLEDGGIGGIGVENWILANGGNMARAFETFSKAAHDENGAIISLQEFRTKYKILDPGINLKFNNHDNFIGILKENGYQAMVKTIENYLGR